MSNTHRDSSRKEWVPSLGASPTVEQVQLGCLQRIADATETMAQNYVRLQNERDQYKRWYEEEQKRRHRTERSVAALKGQIAKLRNQSTAR